MSFLSDLFGPKPYPAHAEKEVEKLLGELQRIGKTEDFLSEHPGGAYNVQCRHIRTREIGARLHELGGFDLMFYARKKLRKPLGETLVSHLDYAWTEIGKWNL